ncbi:DEAD/DEAH box helicase [Deferrisoma camini]|uniref:DEAD/DEAH box helicase n=1 Tax=Deferrisoma camini TaxID=1035120 RepID=UPI0004A40312|nr:DEAD/DEAH box helicase [Deferrisoma camini]
MRADVEQIVQALLRDRNLGPCVTHHQVIEPAPARTEPFPDGVHPDLVQALGTRGIERPYSHQARAAEAALGGRAFVAVTPTASGKTLCYNLPVLTTLLQEPDARALYLFPTKALAQDQLAELQELARAMGRDLPAFTYDGDTPQDVRRRVRDQARIVLTNPDMLHQGILPHHPRWARFFGSLRYVVIDEMHVYRGIFGSHVANVLRRLRRVCRFHGSEPVFLLSSATIRNPGDLARRLTGVEDLVEITDSGAPRARKHLLFVNPPVIDPALGLRASAVGVARRIATRFLREGVSTIAFVRTRLQVEILTRYLKDRFERRPDRKGWVRGYRGGYLPDLRRQIERGLRDGTIRGVVATNALELGIDIGQLEAAVLTGYPGSVASTWQQAGRAGRRTGVSAAVLVASSQPLDQYVITHPETVVGTPPELGLIDPDNLHVLVSHIRCAAFELPFEEGEEFGSEPLEEILAFLEEKGVLRRSGRRWHWIEDAYPAEQVALRTADPDNFAVIDASGPRPRVIAQVDLESAPTTIHPGAVYMVEGRAHQVERLDWEGRKAYVRPVDPDYYTQAISYAKVRVLEAFAGHDLGRGRAEWGEVHVLARVPGYKKIKFYTSENVGYGEVDLPDQEMHTTAAWWVFPLILAEALGLTDAAFLDGIAGLGHALHHLASLHCLCDPSDLGRALGDREGRWDAGPGPVDPAAAPPGIEPTLFLYERYPGGCGLAEGIHGRTRELLEGALELLAACRCESGCPSCVGPPGDVGPEAKAAAQRLLGLLLRTA